VGNVLNVEYVLTVV